MHLEAVDPVVRAKIMPGKAEVPVSYYYQAYEAAVQVFGWGQVSTYLLAGLGDSFATLVTAAEKLVSIGVYPFVVPFVPISGTPLATHPAPERSSCLPSTKRWVRSSRKRECLLRRSKPVVRNVVPVPHYLP